MKKFKKLFAVILSLAMVLGMSLTSFAAPPSNTDTAELKITKLRGGETVKLYQIASAEYAQNGAQGFLKYNWNKGVEFADKDKPTADELNALAKKITEVGNLVETKTLSAEETVYSYNAAAGAYIAIITAADNSTVYNPIILSAAYGKEGADKGSLSGAEIGATDTYLFGTTAVAKSSDVTFSKGMEGYTPDTDEDGNKVPTASVGQVLTYTLNAKVPSYPANAENKTFFMSDTMVTGLTFDYDSLVVKYNNETITGSKTSPKRFEYKGKVIASAVATRTGETITGFNINFIYDNLISDAATGTLYADEISVEYKAVINSTAVVGQTGNENHAELYYAKQPNQGTTWDTPNDKPDTDEASGNGYKDDKKIVYTYQLAFEKEDSESKEKLADARFGIYSDAECTKLIDEVVTNKEGYAVSTKIGAGTYYIKELQAPDGYSLNDTVYQAVASWTSATTTITGEVTAREYTTEKPSEDALQVGWIENGIYYSTKPSDNAKPAYIKSETKQTTIDETIETNVEAGTVTKLTLVGTDEEVGAIPNTTLASLPSTGGIGTTIFTIGGCLIMVVAAALFFASRRKSAK